MSSRPPYRLEMRFFEIVQGLIFINQHLSISALFIIIIIIVIIIIIIIIIQDYSFTSYSNHVAKLRDHQVVCYYLLLS